MAVPDQTRKKLAVGATFADVAGAFQAEIVSRETDGSAFVRFTTLNGESVTALANRIGEVPLPPYIERSPAPTFASTTSSSIATAIKRSTPIRSAKSR